MKAFSIGLEAEVYLNKEEIENLKDSLLEGLLNFREVNEEKSRKIYFKIVYDKYQKELLEVMLIPREVYFGDSDKIIYIINDYFYNKLTETGCYGDRFWDSGKLLIVAEKHQKH